MLTEQQIVIHKEFRTYIRVEEGYGGNMLNTLINAAETNLPVLIKKYVCADFDCIYEDIYSIEQLLTYSAKIKDDEEILAGPYGYISSKALDAYIRFYAKKLGVDLDNIILPNIDIPADQDTEEDEASKQVEGRLTETIILRRQRNSLSRERCLAESGYKCYVCGFDFEKYYGEIGKGFLEVHHKRPMSTYEEDHELPQSELVALCSNCHSMVHRKKDIIDVDKLKRMIEKNKEKK